MMFFQLWENKAEAGEKNHCIAQTEALVHDVIHQAVTFFYPKSLHVLSPNLSWDFILRGSGKQGKSYDCACIAQNTTILK